MSIETVETPRFPLYEQKILSGDPVQTLDWARDFTKAVTDWANQITDITNQQLNQDNSDATYWGSIDSLGEWEDGTWRMIKVDDDDFQLQKRVDGVFIKNVGYAQDN